MTALKQTKTISNAIKARVEYVDNGFKIYLPLNPVPASRPRVTRWGVYYGKIYATWMKQAEAILEEAKTTLDVPLFVTTKIRVTKPRTSKKEFPRGDNDNYEKAIWDMITKKKYWTDDDLIIDNFTSKRFVKTGGHIIITAQPATEASHGMEEN